LAEAVAAGDWILFEDVDVAPSDVSAILNALIETKELFVPSKGITVGTAPGFQMIFTQTGVDVCPIQGASMVRWMRFIMCQKVKS
jgi:midasin (ATPase involved in ribosome maturation)